MQSVVAQTPASYRLSVPRLIETRPVVQQLQLSANLDKDIRQFLIQSRTRNDTAAIRHAHLMRVAKGFQHQKKSSSSRRFPVASRDQSRRSERVEGEFIEQGPPSIGGETVRESIRLENIHKERVDLATSSKHGKSQHHHRRPKSRKKASEQWALPASKRMNTRHQFPEIKTKSLHGDGWMEEVRKIVPHRIAISTPMDEEIDFDRLDMKMAEKARLGKNSSPSTYFYNTSNFRRNDFEIHPEWFSEKLYVQRFTGKPSEADQGHLRLSLPTSPRNMSRASAPHSARAPKHDNSVYSYRPIHSAR